MFSESRFGTIRFGESPVVAVSPVLLSGVAVQAIADGRVKLGAERTVRSSSVGMSGATTFIQRRAAITSVKTELTISSGSAIGAGRGLRGWVQSVAIGSPELKVTHVLRSSQRTTPIAETRIVPTAALGSAGTTVSIASATGVGVGRLLAGIEEQGSGVANQTLEVRRVLSSAQGILSSSEARILSAARLASESLTITTTRLETSFPGLSVWVVQGSRSTVHPEIVRHPVSSTATISRSIQTGLAVETTLTSSVRTFVWAEGSIRASGLLIHNIQGSNALGKLRAARQTGSREIERSVSGNNRLKVVRTLSGSVGEIGYHHVRIIGKKIALLTLQDGTTLSKLSTGRTFSGRSRMAATALHRVKIIREIGSIGTEEEFGILSPQLLRKLSAEGVQIGDGRTLLGRTRSISAVQHEGFLFFGRFAVIPDLRNDRVVVIFAEGRRAVIPRQSEL